MQSWTEQVQPWLLDQPQPEICDQMWPVLVANNKDYRHQFLKIAWERGAPIVDEIIFNYIYIFVTTDISYLESVNVSYTMGVINQLRGGGTTGLAHLWWPPGELLKPSNIRCVAKKTVMLSYFIIVDHVL